MAKSTFEAEYSVLQQIAEEPSTKKKKQILEKNKQLLSKIIHYALDFNKKYNIKQFPPKAPYELGEQTNKKGIFAHLDKLAGQNGAKQKDSHYLTSLCSCEEDIMVIRMILNKDLRCGLSLKTAQKVYPTLPNKDTMLCYYAGRIVIKNGKRNISGDIDTFVSSCGGWENVGVSIKANGVRTKIYDGKNGCSYMSRNGLAYKNFNILDEHVKVLIENIKAITGQEEVILDGEVIHKGEDFQKQMTQLRRLENINPSNFRLLVFDIPSLPGTQQEREKVLKRAYNALEIKQKNKIDILLCTRVVDFESFLTLYNKITNVDKREGVVLKNMTGVYENKRSPFWCKVKTFYSADLVVLRAVPGKKGTKLEKTMGVLVVDYKGVEVRVGSGFDEKSGERDLFLKNPPRMIEVEYKEVTKDGSLWNPTFVRVREDL